MITVVGSSAGRYEVDGYVYNAAEEPKILMTGKWNESMSYQPCDMEGEPLPGTELKEVFIYIDANDSLLISLQGLFCQSCLEMLAWKLAHKPHICRSGMLRRCQKMTNFNTLLSPTS